MKIYTRTGDAGQTGLLGGKRVSKDHMRVSAYGEVDELNAAIGVCASESACGTELALQLEWIQGRLFVLGSELADPGSGSSHPALAAEDSSRLEEWIDRADEQLPPLRNFILPGGSPLGARLHLVRAISRRAERAVVALSHAESVSSEALVFTNRLSDYLFAAARLANVMAGVSEIPWKGQEDA